MWFLPSALNVKVKKFNQARVNGGSNYDSTFIRVTKAAWKRIASLWRVTIFEGDTVKLRETPKAFTTASA